MVDVAEVVYQGFPLLHYVIIIQSICYTPIQVIDNALNPFSIDLTLLGFCHMR